MKALRIIEIEGFEIVTAINEPVCDPMATKREARKRLGPGATYREIILEMVNNPEYFENVKNQENITDTEAAKLAVLLQKAREYERVTRDGEIICDYRGRAWYSYQDGAWAGGKIEHLGDAIPDGAVWKEDLSINQLRAIHEQEELEKIASLSPESRIEAAGVEKEAAKRAAVIKRMESEIIEDSEGLENARIWYRCEIARIEKKYNLPEEKHSES